jgi:hypothetical protein
MQLHYYTLNTTQRSLTCTPLLLSLSLSLCLYEYRAYNCWRHHQVDTTNGVSISPARFGQQFVELVANPTDILLFHRKKKTGLYDETQYRRHKGA